MNTKICYCGSIRVALDAFKKAEYESVLNGDIALLPCCMFVDIEREYGENSSYKTKADELHKRKIDLCDKVVVLNVGGYVGNSTFSEIQYAHKIGKPVEYLEPLKEGEMYYKSANGKIAKITYDPYKIASLFYSNNTDVAQHEYLTKLANKEVERLQEISNQ